ncbi:hypothetical protein RHSIM_Rhsim06G0011000 [Rhododendron simsii]|uniref:non-specific serine/threonine protein kinase n=1 Tax=Rhododendron simsii TaxID=118357 RepID=A0A834GRI3_RHOSS|nr:hypothetical protein RHSIM_Rhsim06G0011000 [Rhododendron simsii]
MLITFQLTSLLSEIGLNIQEAHAFSTSDGYALDVFVVDGWPIEEMEQLKDALERKIPTIEIEDVNTADKRIASRLKIEQAAKALQEARVRVQLLEEEHALAVQEDLAIASAATSSPQLGPNDSVFKDVVIRVVVKDSRNCNLGASRVALNSRRFCPVQDLVYHYYVAVFFLCTKFSGISEPREWGVHGMRKCGRPFNCAGLGHKLLFSFPPHDEKHLSIVTSCNPYQARFGLDGEKPSLLWGKKYGVSGFGEAEGQGKLIAQISIRELAIGLGVAKVVAGSLTSSSSASLSSCTFESALHVNRVYIFWKRGGMGDTESCSSTATESASTKRRMRRQKFDVYEDICQRLRASENGEASQPGFEDELWNHFNRFSSRFVLCYAMAVYVEQPEDVIMHMKLLDRAVDPTTRPAFEVRIVQVPVTDVSCGETVHSMRNVDPQTSDAVVQHMPLACHQALKLLRLTIQMVKVEVMVMVNRTFFGKYFCKLTSVLSDVGLNIQEAHAFSTTDGYSLDIFVVDGWSSEETEGLKEILQREIPKIENQFRSKHQFKSPAEVLCQTGSELSHDLVKIPSDDVDVWELDPMLLKFDHIIATGSCKELYKGTYGSQDVAIKVLTGEYLNADVQREFGQEVFILRKVRHKNVVQFIGACTRPPSLCIVTEFMSRGSVFDYLHKQKRIFKLPAILKVAIDVSKGMNYLHHNKIVHRDLKAANLLMDENDVVKVADFGVAKVQTPTGVMTAETGTYRWMAPEHLKLNLISNPRSMLLDLIPSVKVIEHKPYDGKADVFSFGIVLWELLTRKVPYEQLTPLQAAVGVVQKGLRPLVPPNTHPKMAALLERCWQQNPSSRPDFSEITEMLHQILNEVTKERKTVHSPKTKEEKIVTRMPFLGGSSKHADRCAVKKQESADG